jgi:hypothetical protein
LLVLAPALVDRARYTAKGAAYIVEQQGIDRNDGKDLDRLIDIVKQRNDGRVYAGLRGNWGKQYAVGNVPVHARLANREVDAIGFTFRVVTSLSTDVEASFDESNPAQYQMLNVKYLMLPSDRAPQVPAELIAESGRHRLFGVSTSGYFQVVDRSAPISADRSTIRTASDVFRKSDLASRNVYPGIAFAGGSGAAPSFSGANPPEQPAGQISAQTHELQRGVFNAAVDMNRPAVVLLKATYDPRLRATIDGKAAVPVMMAPSFIGVDVPAGAHSVSFGYVPYGGYPLLLFVGLLTFLTLLLVPRRAALLSGDWRGAIRNTTHTQASGVPSNGVLHPVSPAVHETQSPRDVSRWMFIGFILVTFIVYFISSRGEGAVFNYFVRLADAFVHGRLDVSDQPVHLAELVPWQGKWYVIFPPVPAVLMIPFVAVFGAGFSQPLFSVLMGALNVGLAYKLFARLFGAN